MPTAKTCGGTITASDTFITLQTPNFDSRATQMAKDQRCSWLIKVIFLLKHQLQVYENLLGSTWQKT